MAGARTACAASVALLWGGLFGMTAAAPALGVGVLVVGRLGMMTAAAGVDGRVVAGLAAQAVRAPAMV